MNASVVPYHWDDREKLYRDYKIIKNIYEVYLKELTKVLNSIHSVNFSERFWRILIGPWLGYFIQIVYDRWYMLKKANEENNICGVTIIDSSPVDFIPNDMNDWIAQTKNFNPRWFVGDHWTEMICGQILKNNQRLFGNIPLKKIPKQNNLNLRKKLTQTKPNKVITLFKKLFVDDSENYFKSSSLKFLDSIKIQSSLCQFPKIWKSLKTLSFNVDLSEREKIKLSLKKFAKNNNQNFIYLLNKIIPLNIPSAYFEGFKELLSFSKSLPWPKNPKTIFDTESWNSDDIFKIWAAQKVEAGTSLIIGQHGGSFGVSKWNFNEDHQIDICDKFLSWGWSCRHSKKVVPFGKLTSCKKIRFQNKNEIALLVEMSIPRMSYHMYSIPVGESQFEKYLQDQWKFIGKLPIWLRKKVLVRLASQDFDLCQRQRWRDRYPEILVNSGRDPIANLLKKTKIYISTYNATTYLDSLSMNIPTIIFWNPAHWEIRNEVKENFRELEAAGIFFSSAEDAARQMTRIWHNVEDWWGDPKIQSVRLKFCKKFAFCPKNLSEKFIWFFKNTFPKTSKK